MKKLILLALVLCSAATMLAQTNRMSYQAVVRNSANELVAEENLTVAISISDANGTSAYSETHSVTSNRNGMISLMIGEGSSQSGNMTAVDWRTAQIHTVITLPGGATLSNTTPVNAVPYAFYADSVDIHWVSDALDDYLEHHSIGSIVETDPTVPDWAKEATKPAYDYSEINGTPTIPTTVAELTDAANYATTADLAAKANAADVYTQTETDNLLSDKANVTDIHNSTITIQKNGDMVGSFTLNQAGDQTINLTVPSGGGGIPQTINISGNVITLSDGGGSVTLPAESDPTVPAWAKESTKPAYDYAEITNTPDMSGYLTAETDPTVPDWAKEANKPAYDYSEIANTPDLSGYLTTESDPTVPAWAKESTKPAYDYAEITNTPDLSGYLTAETDPTVPDWAKEATKPAYDYSEIANTPTIPTVNDGTLTITLPDGTSETFTANQSGSTTVTIPAPAAMTAADLLALVNGMTDAEKEALKEALGVTSGGEEPTTFTCGTSKMVDADGNEYETVLIGTQCWTKTNLRVAPAGATDETSSGASSYTEPYYYVNSSVDAATYGYYYNWKAAKLACPAGWHLPSDAEWTALTDYVSGQSEYTCGGNTSYIAKALASTEGWITSSVTCAVGNNPSANNVSGFGAVPAGAWNDGFSNGDDKASFWSSMQATTNGAWGRAMLNFSTNLMRNNFKRSCGFSVRCLRD